MASLNTVNLSEYADGKIIGIRSFSDNDEGNKEAEEIFKEIMVEIDDVTDEEIANCIEDGYYEISDYQLFLTHSS